jgi:tRNA threonylcarbamoyladenosine biosynthesis protein TsaE
MGLGEAWGREASPGWVIGLIGELGAGKTQLVKGLARGLGVADRVHSPTFTLVNEYCRGRLPLLHLDLYRLETWAQFHSAGIESYLYDPPGVAVIEWFDRCDAWIARGVLTPPGPRFRRVELETRSELGRVIRYDDTGA